MLISAVAYLIANAIGLLIAILLLPGFIIDPLSFIIAVLIFSGVQTLLVWIGSLLAGILLPIYVFKQLSEKAQAQ